MSRRVRTVQGCAGKVETRPCVDLYPDLVVRDVPREQTDLFPNVADVLHYLHCLSYPRRPAPACSSCAFSWTFPYGVSSPCDASSSPSSCPSPCAPSSAVPFQPPCCFCPAAPRLCRPRSARCRSAWTPGLPPWALSQEPGSPPSALWRPRGPASSAASPEHIPGLLQPLDRALPQVRLRPLRCLQGPLSGEASSSRSHQAWYSFQQASASLVSGQEPRASVLLPWP
mmetsp:Transcript_9305/g.22422  ORF Transcript_9305/g.22422 Transcript_9305/m.22422 type:complete len:227 (+) Transcript_9305:240-920(+)